MDVNEYKAQKATGTIDYRLAAVQTESKEVLASIVEDTQDRDAHAAVAMNPNTDPRTLTRIIIERGMPDFILDICVWHPVVTREILTIWMQRDYMDSLESARVRMHAFQAAAGEEKRIKLLSNAAVDMQNLLGKFPPPKKHVMFPAPDWHTPYSHRVIGSGGTYTSSTTELSDPPESRTLEEQYTLDCHTAINQIGLMVSEEDKVIGFDSISAT